MMSGDPSSGVMSLDTEEPLIAGQTVQVRLSVPTTLMVVYVSERSPNISSTGKRQNSVLSIAEAGHRRGKRDG